MGEGVAALPPYKLVTSPADWQACLAKLRGQPRLALDLEANSMYAYREQVCLIQITIPGQDYIVDPLAGLDLSALGEIIVDPGVEKIFHAAEYDLILLKRQYGWELRNLFDTMWAARILGYEGYGLAGMLEQIYGIELDKRFQKADWRRRPLPPEQLAYARLDTHYLLQLRDHLAAELAQRGRLEEAAEIFAAQTRITLNDNEFDPESFWSINGRKNLSPQQLAVLRELNIFRDQEARRRDQPVFKILGNRTLIELAQTLPRNTQELHRVHGMSAGQVKRYGAALLRVIEKGRQAPPPTRPRRPKRPPEQVMHRYEKLRRWRKNRAARRGVESDVILSRAAMWQIARQNPQSVEALAQIEAVGEWHCREYGEEIIGLLRE